MSGRPGRRGREDHPQSWALTGNAADAKQVKAAERAEKRWQDAALRDMREMLTMPAARRVIWRLMYESRISFAHAHEALPHLTASVWDGSAKIHYNSGRQDMGLLLQGWVQQADPMALIALLTEALRDQAQRDSETLASRTKAVTEDEPNA